jgi:hypothetical protein
VTVRATLRIAILALAFALATLALGWWGVPIVGGIWGFLGRTHQRPAGTAAIAAAAGWGGLLLWAAAEGPVARLAAKLGATMLLPGAALMIVTLLFAALLAWSAAAVVGGVARRGTHRGARRGVPGVAR